MKKYLSYFAIFFFLISVINPIKADIPSLNAIKNYNYQEKFAQKMELRIFDTIIKLETAEKSKHTRLVKFYRSKLNQQIKALDDIGLTKDLISKLF